MFATQPYRRISDDRRKPLARYGAMGARFASGLLICYTTSWGTTGDEVRWIERPRFRDALDMLCIVNRQSDGRGRTPGGSKTSDS
jgi:hypothetical protein